MATSTTTATSTASQTVSSTTPPVENAANGQILSDDEKNRFAKICGNFSFLIEQNAMFHKFFKGDVEKYFQNLKIANLNIFTASISIALRIIRLYQRIELHENQLLMRLFDQINIFDLIEYIINPGNFDDSWNPRYNYRFSSEKLNQNFDHNRNISANEINMFSRSASVIALLKAFDFQIFYYVALRYPIEKNGNKKNLCIDSSSINKTQRGNYIFPEHVFIKNREVSEKDVETIRMFSTSFNRYVNGGIALHPNFIETINQVSLIRNQRKTNNISQNDEEQKREKKYTKYTNRNKYQKKNHYNNKKSGTSRMITSTDKDGFITKQRVIVNISNDDEGENDHENEHEDINDDHENDDHENDVEDDVKDDDHENDESTSTTYASIAKAKTKTESSEE